jgi:hypothetical protein
MNLRKPLAAAVSVAMILSLTSAATAAEPAKRMKPKARAPLKLAIAGSLAGGGSFAGTLSILRFVAHDDQVVAVGMLSGTVTGAMGNTVATVLRGPVELPVTVNDGVVAPPRLPRPTIERSGPRQSRASEPPLIEPQQGCELVHVELGAVNFDVLGLTVTTLPVAIDLTAGGEGTAVLGHLACTILETANNVLGLVDLLNAVLGLLTSLV